MGMNFEIISRANLTLRPGDEFCVENTGIIAKGIDFAQLLYSKDGESTYTHSGLILSREGQTLEARKRVCRQNLFDAYSGRRIIIARPTHSIKDRQLRNPLTNRQKNQALARIIKEHEGDIYPFWRIPLHVIPSAAKYVSWNGRFVVCSELTAKFAWYLGSRHSVFCGATPDDRADEYRTWRNYDLLAEGVLE